VRVALILALLPLGLDLHGFIERILQGPFLLGGLLANRGAQGFQPGRRPERHGRVESARRIICHAAIVTRART